jgi:S-(hydroxymethyl)glutathione dehydrogenase / alcohol dehydrogenase
MVKAAVMRAYNEPLSIEEIELHPPREDEVLVKVTAAGVCHSDLSVIECKIPIPPPAVLGHEGAGIVEEVGSGVSDLKPGDHVLLAWVQNCGKCHYCRAGKTHLCPTGLEMGISGQDNVFEKDGIPIGKMAGVGCFAEKTVVRATAAIKIRDDVPLDRACLVGCGVMTGVGAAINTVRIEPGDTVAVFGCGGVGLNVIQGAALCGASTIVAVDLLDSKLEQAKLFGATHTVNGKTTDAVEAIKAATGGLGVDYAFEVIGAPAVIAQAFNSVKRGGAAVVVGVPGFDQQVSVPGIALPLEEKSLVGSLYGSANLNRDMPRMIDLYMHKKLKIDELISRTIKLEQINEAFDAMKAGEVNRSVILY